jgi:uncharacterized delta-60 repeat protein
MDPDGGPAGAVAGAAGQLDSSFSGDGTALTTLAGRSSRAGDVAALPDGGVVVVGDSNRLRAGGHDSLVIQRYRADGSLDPSFGRAGIVTTAVGGAEIEAGFGEALALQADGRIVVAATAAVGREGADAMVVARYLPNGAVDPTFSHDGVRLIRGSPLCGLLATDVALAGDGAIVVAGDAGCGGESDEGTHVAVARLTTDGRLDRSFAGDGVWTTWTGCEVAAVVLGRDDSLVIAGQAGYHDYCGGPMYVARLHRDGTFDAGFGRHGRALIRFPGTDGALAHDVALDHEGRIVLAGSADNFASTFDDPTRSALALARLLPDGSLDRSFANSGRAATRVPWAPVIPAFALTLGPDDTIVAAGAAGSQSLNHSRFFIARYQPSGTLDPSFGTAGIETVSFDGAREFASGVTLDTTGAIVAAGESLQANTDSIAVLRLLSQ